MSTTDLTSGASVPFNGTAAPTPTPQHTKLPLVIITPLFLALLLILTVVIVHSIKQGKLFLRVKHPAPLPVLPVANTPNAIPACRTSAANPFNLALDIVTTFQGFVLRCGNVLREWKDGVLGGKREEKVEVQAVVYERGVKKRTWKEFQERYGRGR